MLLASNSKSISSAEMSITFQALHYFYRNRDGIAFKGTAAWYTSQNIPYYCVLQKNKVRKIMR